eukprot:2163420-Amphidinium_carterae.1
MLQEGDDAGSDGAGFRPVYSSATSGNEMPDWVSHKCMSTMQPRHISPRPWPPKDITLSAYPVSTLLFFLSQSNI